MSKIAHFLKTAKVRSIPVWFMLLITIGTVTGAFLYISNSISTNVNPSSRPIELTGSFDASPYIDELSFQIFGYIINDDSQDVGYIVIQFLTYGEDIIGPSDFALEIDVQYESSGIIVHTQQVTGYPINNGPNGMTYVFEVVGGGPIDFGDADSESGGFIIVSINYHVDYNLDATIYLSSTSS